MASSTTNYNLIKPDYEDSADIKDLNDNFDTIDMAMNNLEEGKQAALTTAQIAAVNSGIDSTKVAQIETNKNNIADIKDGTSINSFGDVETALGSKQNTISDLATIRSGAALGTTAVQPETGKGLSTNDFTTAEKTKLDGLADIKSIGTGLNLDDNGELTATGGGSGGTTNYNDLSNKPQINGNTLSGNKTSAQLGLASASDIPTVPITAIQKNGTGITPVSGTVNITVPTTAADVSALPDTTKYAAALSLTINSSTFVMTGQLKDQNGDNLGTAQTIDLPLESVVVGGSYNSQTKKVVLTLQNGNTIEFSVADLVSGLQTELSASNKLNPAYIDYDSAHAAVSDTEKAAWNSKQSALTAEQLAAVNSGVTEDNVEQIETNKNNISWLVDTGVKNLLDYGKIKTFNPRFTWSGNTGTYNGVTIKIESNAVKISASNTSSTVHIYVSAETDTWKNGNTYRLTGVPQASAENVNLNIQSGSPDYYTYYSKISNQEVTFPNVDTRIRFSIESGATFSEVTIPLMMCSVAAYSASSAYQPYALSNAELTAAIQALQAQLSNQ